MRSQNEKPIVYVGKLSKWCEALVAEKQALGFHYIGAAQKLVTFSKFSLSFDFDDDTLPKELVQAWLTKKPTDAERNVADRCCTVRQLAEYMARMGCAAYIPGKFETGKLHKTFIPYIFTHDEIKRLFTAVDSLELKKHSCAPRRHKIMPVLFRLLYCCGLRISEATNLKGEDVDITRGILTIKDSKFSRTRYVPLSDELTSVCSEYAQIRLIGDNDNDWFFAAPDGGKYSETAVYHVFRGLLWDAGISHGGKGKGPRMHDLRHSFAVHCLQKWVAKNADPTTLLPRLTAYLGHEGFQSTEQYLRMTAEVYPEISALMQDKYGYLIPTMEVPYEDD